MSDSLSTIVNLLTETFEIVSVRKKANNFFINYFTFSLMKK